MISASLLVGVAPLGSGAFSFVRLAMVTLMFSAVRLPMGVFYQLLAGFVDPGKPEAGIGQFAAQSAQFRQGNGQHAGEAGDFQRHRSPVGICWYHAFTAWLAANAGWIRPNCFASCRMR